MSKKENKDFIVPEVDQKDFVFVQQDKAIHDLKFETKPTTFFKDAMRRFTKNKSSVAATYIIGFLMILAIFVPILNPNDIKTSQNELRFLPPRINGFQNTAIFNGKEKVKGVVVDMNDPEGPVPVNYVRTAIVGDITMYESTITSASPYGRGGSVFLASTQTNRDIGYRSSPISVDLANTYALTIDLSSNATLEVAPNYAFYADVTFPGALDVETVTLFDFSSTFTSRSLADISALILAEKPAEATSDVVSLRLRFHVLSQGITHRAALHMNQVIVTNVNDAEDMTFASHNFVDGNSVLVRNGILEMSPYTWNIINGAGTTSLVDGKITRADFTYDPYEAAFGKREMVLGLDKLEAYKREGYIDFPDFPAAFSRTNVADMEAYGNMIMAAFDKDAVDHKSPVVDIYGFNVLTNGPRPILDFDCQVVYYRILGRNAMPSYMFGTNQFGQDYFKKVFFGLGISLLLGLLAASINIFIGLIWGAISGYYGGGIDIFMERITEVLGGIPTIVVLTLIILHLGNSFPVFLLAMVMTGWIGTAATTRSQFYRYKRREYVLASRTLGAKDSRLIFRHILPNSVGPIFTSSVLMIPGIIFAEATISYLGLGLQGLPSLGVSLSESQQYIFSHPYLVSSGAIVISLLMISFNLFGNGLRDAFNPSLKGVE